MILDRHGRPLRERPRIRTVEEVIAELLGDRFAVVDGMVVPKISGGVNMARDVTLVDTSGNPLTATNPGAMEIADGAGGGQLARVAPSSDALGAGANGIVTQTINYLYRPDTAVGERARTPTVFKDVNTAAITPGTPVTIWTPAAGKKFRLMGWQLSISANGAIIFKEAGATLFHTSLMAAGVGVAGPPMGNGLLASAANDALQVDVSGLASVAGVVFGTEE